MFIGPWTTKPYIPFNLVVQNEKFNILGMELGVDNEECTKVNYIVVNQKRCKSLSIFDHSDD